MLPNRVHFASLRLCRPHFSTYVAVRNSERSDNASSANLVGSAKLFADAALEEEQPGPSAPSKRLQDILAEQPNWTGDERIEDTVLRMLVDKYKPLRSGTIQTAEQKMKKAPSKIPQYHEDSPPLHSSVADGAATYKPFVPPGSSWASVPLLPPGPPDHRPWHTEYKIPDHAQVSVRVGRFPMKTSAQHTGASAIGGDEQTRRAEKELHRKLGRLNRARESSLDYRLGLGNTNKHHAPSQINPVSMKGWTNLVEDRIEKARRAGLFTKVKGRGKPLERIAEEHNPFIAREEYLMNRIVKRNGAAPPWVQLQGDGWTRHAIRALTISAPLPELEAIRRFRDPRWSAKESTFHTAALAEVNDKVRRYNALAPYAVRRTLHVLDAELASVYIKGEVEIPRMLEERARARPLTKQAVDVPSLSLQFQMNWMKRLRQFLMTLLQRLEHTVRRS
ncbi:unnamed protein product [Mycena citricolor]|uniref:DnaJ homologue subfamily C member 28 conserved domain-containing protein n=1 Tax=Mycena citricolor TaxID=2018698 RepID=A0AAD2HNB3_9AGAR|nr:unnamed protein product [Mycena citricolor]